jgi:hypothetical protein
MYCVMYVMPYTVLTLTYVMLYVIFLMLSLNWLFISSVIELMAELVVCSSDTMMAEYDVSMKTDSSNRNRNTILEDGLTGTSLAPVMTCSGLYLLSHCHAVTLSRCHTVTL